MKTTIQASAVDGSLMIQTIVDNADLHGPAVVRDLITKHFHDGISKAVTEDLELRNMLKFALHAAVKDLGPQIALLGIKELLRTQEERPIAFQEGRLRP